MSKLVELIVVVVPVIFKLPNILTVSFPAPIVTVVGSPTSVPMLICVDFPPKLSMPALSNNEIV